MVWYSSCIVASTLGEVIARVRARRLHTLRDAALQIGCSHTALALWEQDTGVPSVRHLEGLARYLGMTATDVLELRLEAERAAALIRFSKPRRALRANNQAGMVAPTPAPTGPGDTHGQRIQPTTPTRERPAG